MFIATVSSQRQVTLPKSLLDLVGLAGQSKAIVAVEGNKITISPAPEAEIADLGGSLAKYAKTEKAKTIRQIRTKYCRP